jgi:hypothetical protein
MLEQLILYFVCKTKGHITKTQLVKFLYLADLYSVKWTGQQLTDLDWCYYSHGPWNQEIDTVLDQIDGLFTQQQENSLLIKAKDESFYAQDFTFSKGLILMLENIRKEWAGSGGQLNDLLDYVYATEPMLAAKSKHTPEEKVLLNLHLEREKLLAELGV